MSEPQVPVELIRALNTLEAAKSDELHEALEGLAQKRRHVDCDCSECLPWTY